MGKLEEIHEFLLKRRNEKTAKMEQDAIEKDGFFDADSYSGGNFDDCYYMGKEVGEAELIEEILSLILLKE